MSADVCRKLLSIQFFVFVQCFVDLHPELPIAQHEPIGDVQRLAHVGLLQ